MNLTKEIEEFIISLFNIGCIKFGLFKTKIGLMSPVYFDLRLIVSHPKLMDKLSQLLLQELEKNKTIFDHVCGVPYTALPIATLVSVKSNKSMLIRRRETKAHGTMKMIEGQFEQNDVCLIVEDVVTSGSSILETVKDLQNEHLKVKDVLIVLDRKQGGVDHLKCLGYNVYSLFCIFDVVNVLKQHNLLDQDMVDKVTEYITNTKIDCSSVSFSNKNESNARLSSSFEHRSRITKSKLTKTLLEIMLKKQTMLSLAADVTTSRELLDLANKLGPYICLLKTHSDIIEDFSENTSNKLCELAVKHNFLILEDRKFADIGSVVSQQYKKIVKWADVVTAHALTGDGVIQGLTSQVDGTERGCFLVAEMSCTTVVTQDYIKKAIELASRHGDYVVGVVCQSGELLTDPGLLQLTPGVKMSATGDNMDQRYVSPETAVTQRGADIVVVGRGIITAPDAVQTAREYSRVLWGSYLSRIDQ